MTKNDLLNAISEKTQLSKASCEKIIDAMMEEIKNSLLHGEKVTIKGFAVFEVKDRLEREGRNPKTGEVCTFPPVRTAKCRFSKELRDFINGKRE